MHMRGTRWARQSSGWPMLAQLAAKGRTDKMKELIDLDREIINETDSYGCTALHRTAANGEVEATQLLLSEGAEVGVLDKSGRSPFYLASASWQVGVMRALMKVGASPFDKNLLKPPIILCIANPPALKFLIDSGCDTEVETSVGRTLLEVATSSGMDPPFDACMIRQDEEGLQYEGNLDKGTGTKVVRLLLLEGSVMRGKEGAKFWCRFV